MSIPSWVAEYVGIPWKVRGRDLSGVDCWGLVYLIYRDHFGVTLPTYTEDYDGTSWREVSKLIAGEIKAPWRSTGDPRFGDVIVLRIDRRPWHCGLVLQPGRSFVHCEDGIGQVAVDRYDDSPQGRRWRNRVDGVYRHEVLWNRPSA